MNDRNSTDRFLLWIAKLVLDARDVERVIEPAVADRSFERAEARGPLEQSRASVVGTLAVVAAIALAFVTTRTARAREVPWRSFAPLAACVFASALALRALGLPGLAERQLAFATIGAIAAFAIVTSRSSLASKPILLGTIAIGLAWITAIFGESFEGARRWLPIASLRVQPFDLAKPLFVLAIAGLAMRSRRAIALFVAFAMAAIVVRDPVSVMVSMTVTLVALFASRASLATRASAALIGAALAVVAFVRRAPPGIDPHTDRILDAIRDHAGTAAAIAIVALLVIVATRAISFARVARADSRVLAASAAAAIVAQLVAQAALGEGLSLVSYGGSCLVAVFALFAITAVSARAPTPA